MSKTKKIVSGLAVLAIALPAIIFSFGLESNLTNETYLTKLHLFKHKILESKSDDVLIKYAYDTCSMLDSGKTSDDVLDYIIKDEKGKKEIVMWYGATIVAIAVDVYCPQYKDQTEAWVY